MVAVAHLIVFLEGVFAVHAVSQAQLVRSRDSDLALHEDVEGPVFVCS
jgi:hypothetical protein